MNAMVHILDWTAEGSASSQSVLWEASEAAIAMSGTQSADFAVSGVAIDSRDVRPGDLFFALKGETADGHAYIAKAMEQGAVAAVVDHPVETPHILVRDTARALEQLGAAARERAAEAKIIGVTGSAGKTSVKEALFSALDRASRGRAHCSVKSYNNHVGVPLSLARMPGRSRYGILEMGMNHAGEIAALTRQVKPDVAIITTIAPAHIEMLGSEEAIADAKAEIFAGVKSGGVAILPADSPHFERLRDHAAMHGVRVIAFGHASYADVRLLDAIAAPEGGSLVTIDMGDRRVCYTIAQPGDHWVMNSLAVMAAVREIGGDLGAAGLALAEMQGLAGRGAQSEISVPGGTALLIDESYNANPASMQATLVQFGSTRARRRIAVLGAMKELGVKGPAYHARLADPVIAADIDHVILVGAEMEPLADALEMRRSGDSNVKESGKLPSFMYCDNAREAETMLQGFGLANGDAILVKGSNSVGLGALVNALVHTRKD